ncbi:MAG: hypothetical protein HY903_00915 [Deltaproteobacteria bacterium]|nr:hypothetical protein [Deltaproteobacteria bacterium]
MGRGQPRRVVAGIGLFILCCAVLFCSAAFAQGPFVQLSPGPLWGGHAKWDNPTGCLECHKALSAKKEMLCLDCHDHAALKEAIDQKRLHATFSQPCARCHPEHKGRTANIIDWALLGGQTGFDHKRTGFPLTGMHDKAVCSACHRRRLASGRASYQGVSRDCDTCHKNPHAFTKEELRHECLKCHVVGGVPPKAMTAAQIPFNHGDDTGVPLVGKHLQVHCVKCHAKGKMSMQGESRRSCASCHKDRHGKVFLAHPCAACHTPARAFAKADYDHGQGEFPLAGGHEKPACAKCHRDANVKPAKSCDSCHKDPHRKRFAALACLQCHKPAAPSTVAIAHEAVAKLKLSGKHTKLTCRACHRGKSLWDWEKLANHECRDCHRHKNAHNGQFGDKPCVSCHDESGGKKLVFDHNRDSPFPLAGAHAKLAAAKKCDTCHKNGLFRTGKRACTDCHKDPHKGDLGADCNRCHSPEVKFAKIVFDHDKAERFRLEGLHQQVECKKCHPDRQYRTGRLKCSDCHKAAEPHKGRLGDACERCHLAAKGAPRFDHERMTQFVRTGRHLQVACTFCHRPPPAAGPPVAGWTAGLEATPADRTFPVMGRTCAECHKDNHDGRFGAACQSCHKPTAFKDVSATMHDTGAFRLAGVHATLPCGRCHEPGLMLAGQGELCQRCHLDKDPHGGALGPFCGDCHRQIEWLPARFVHAQTGFALRGAHHRTACRGCHGVGTYAGTSTDCEFCHQQDALKAKDPIHTAELRPCDRCHTEAGFVPARRFHFEWPLVGRHGFVHCRSCHGSGVYAGTPDTCESCHLQRYYDPSTVPNHVAAGYPITCEDCHSPMGWIPATR